jgi:hypothetical protein
MIPISGRLDQATLTLLQEIDPVVQRYRAFFALFDWSLVPERATDRPWPGSPPHPHSAYIKTLLVKICEHKDYITDLRAFLIDHPLLVLELGFRPALDPAQPYGFAVEQTVPGARWLRQQQRTLDQALLQALLSATVHALQAEIPAVGSTIAVDVKHIYAWVQQNNPKAYVPDRYDPAQQPTGDPDCRLGVKRSSNQTAADGRTVAHKEYLWGYGTGVVTAPDPRYGDVVLAEYTQPFNEADVSYYRPLYERTVATLGFRPTNVTADAAFDAWYVYQTAAEVGGIAAIPLNTRGHAPPARSSVGLPRCEKGLSMVPSYQFAHPQGYPAQIFRCPLTQPGAAETCDHEQFAKGPGCVKYLNISRGGQQRATLDRESAEYAAIYRQRTSTERINSQSKAYGSERPKARQGASVRTLNTLIYLVINAQALQRARALNAAAAPAA